MDKMHILTKAVPAAWVDPLERWELVLRAGGRAERTIDTRVRHMRYLARQMELHAPDAVTSAVLLEWCGEQDWSPETRHGYYVSFRSFFGWLHAENPEDDPCRFLPIVRRPRGLPRPISIEGLEAALSKATQREALIMYLGACAGLRASEIAAVHRDDLVEDLAGYSLRIVGKGSHVRLVPLEAWLADLIRQACARRSTGWAFPSKYGGHLNGASISKVAARVLPAPWTLHTLRHRFATTAYRAERDILAVQRLLGHASVETTQRYAEPDASAMRVAVSAAAGRIPHPAGGRTA